MVEEGLVDVQHLLLPGKAVPVAAGEAPVDGSEKARG